MINGECTENCVKTREKSFAKYNSSAGLVSIVWETHIVTNKNWLII